MANENGFVLRLSLSDVFAPQLALDDIEGLKRVTAVDPEIWMEWVDPIVAKVLSSGDVNGAKNNKNKYFLLEGLLFNENIKNLFIRIIDPNKINN